MAGIAQSAVVVGGLFGVGLNHFVPIEEAWAALGIEPRVTTLTAGDLVGAAAALPRTGAQR